MIKLGHSIIDSNQRAYREILIKLDGAILLRRRNRRAMGMQSNTALVPGATHPEDHLDRPVAIMPLWSSEEEEDSDEDADETWERRFTELWRISHRAARLVGLQNREGVAGNRWVGATGRAASRRSERLAEVPSESAEEDSWAISSSEHDSTEESEGESPTATATVRPAQQPRTEPYRYCESSAREGGHRRPAGKGSGRTEALDAVELAALPLEELLTEACTMPPQLA